MIPDTLRDRDQWVCWQYQCRNCWTTYDSKRGDCPECDGDVSKVPIDPATADLAKSNSPDTWADLDTAQQYHDKDSDTQGIGLMFDSEGLLAGVDLDDCRDPDTGEIDDWAADVVNRLDSFTEVSPSGTGLHVYVLGFVPDGGNWASVGDGEIEIYDKTRYFTVTGDHVEDTPESVKQRNDALSAVHNEYVADGSEDTQEAPENTPDTGLDESELIEKAKNAENGEKFRRLWNGQTGGYESHSEARQALANILAFWTGGDKRQMLRLFKQSGLYRDEDDERTFKNYEIPTALEGRTEFYDPEKATDGGAVADDSADVQQANKEYELGPPTWEDVKQLLQSNENDTTTRACNLAADILTQQHDFVTIRETGAVYYYDDTRGYYVRKGTTYIEEMLNDKLPGYVNPHRIRTIRDQVVAQNYISATEFQPPQGKVCVKNGVLNLDTRELEPHSPDYYFTAQLNVKYHPEATTEQWPGFLERSVADPADVDKLEEFIGYCLEAWHHNRDKNLFVVGPTQSGKGTFQKTVKSLFGSQPTVVHLTPQQIADTRFDVAHLKDAMLNTVNDINASKIEDSGSLKRIFAGEGVKLESKNKDANFGEPKAKHLFTANWLPRIVGQDEAVWRRLLIVEFPNKVSTENRDIDLPVKLAGGRGEDGTEYEGELSGILNRALEARDRLHEHRGFTNDRDRDETRKKWDSWRDGHKRFLYTQFRITGDSDDRVDKETYYRAFKEFAGRKGYELKTKNAVTTALQYVPKVETRDSEYTGLVWREEDAAEPDSGSQSQLSDSQNQRVSKAKQWVDEFATPVEAADRDEIVAYADSQGFDTDKIQNVIDNLLKKGELQQPQSGELRQT